MNTYYLIFGNSLVVVQAEDKFNARKLVFFALGSVEEIYTEEEWLNSKVDFNGLVVSL